MDPIQLETLSDVEKLPKDTSQSWMEWLAGDIYTSGWRSIVQPPRWIYSVEELGPREFTMNGKKIQREDLQLKSLQGEILECSHYHPLTSAGSMKPCVVYLHGHGSCRLEAKTVLNALLPRDISVFCFDFMGSGMSEGKYATLGMQEEKNLISVLRHLRKSGRVSSIALWGRSMGASVAILRAAKDHRLSACVLDSPFAELRTVADDLVNQRIHLPQFMVDIVVEAIRSEIIQHAGCDLQGMIPLNSAPKATCPAFFGAASDDNFIAPHHSEELHLAWGGKSHHRTFQGGHNDLRPQWFMDEVANFLVEHMHTWISDFEVVPLKRGGVSCGSPISFQKVPQIYVPLSPTKHSTKLSHRKGPETLINEEGVEVQPEFPDPEMSKVPTNSTAFVISKWYCDFELSAHE